MIPFAVSFISGNVVYNFFAFFPFAITLLCIVSLIVLLFSKLRRAQCFLLLLLFAFGVFYSSIRDQDLPGVDFPDRDLFLSGTVIDIPEMSGERGRFTLGHVNIEGRQVQGRVRLSLVPEIFYNRTIPDHVLPSHADEVAAVVRLKEPSVLRNPGVSSYDPGQDGIIAQGYVKELSVVGRKEGLLVWIQSKRQELGRIIDRSLFRDNASFLKAILPGLKKSITQEVRDAFSATGLAHLLSISGTHFGLLAFIMFKTTKMFIKLMPERFLIRFTLFATPSQVAAVLTIPVLFMYAFISGASTPTVRSLIMICIYLLALFLGRKDQWLNSLSIAAVFILLWQPQALFDVSFQLSFIAVLCIGYVLEKRLDPGEKQPVMDRLEKDSKGRQMMKGIFQKVKTALLITLAAVFGTAPFVAIYFKQFPLVAPITNLIVTPLVCFFILPFGFITGFIALLFQMPSMPLMTVTDQVTSLALYLIDAISQIPHATVHIHNPSFLIMMLYFLSLYYAVKGRIKLRFLPVIIVLCVYLFIPYFIKEDNLSITFLDVGQGESSVVKLPDTRIMLIDGGMHTPDMGRMVVAPYLWSQGAREIDFLVVSHPHPDHFGGLAYIMDNFRVGEIWVNGRETPVAREFFQKIQNKKIPQRILNRGDLVETSQYRIVIFHPTDGFFADSPRGDFSNENNDSLVMKVESKSLSVLFTGDIETEAEESMVQLGHWLKSDIIKVPHHGSKTSNTPAFIETVRPRVAVVSVGKNNPFKHPHAETIQRYRDAGLNIFRTDRDGAIRITSGKFPQTPYEIKTDRDFRLKKVENISDEWGNLKLLL
jgi:competence protein ComEC